MEHLAKELRMDRSTKISSFNGYPDELSENMKYLETLGGPDTYNHFPTGWATAFSTPFQMFQTLFAVCRRDLRPSNYSLA